MQTLIEAAVFHSECLSLKPGHALRCAKPPRRAIHGADLLKRRPAIENGDRKRLQIGAQTQQSLRWKLRGMHAGKEFRLHARCSVSHAPAAGHTRAGGFFCPITMGEKRCLSRRTSK
jgi:hypothetical protein